MKLRIKDDTLRLRLTRTEVGTLCDQGAVAARTRFAPGRHLTYALVADAHATGLHATFEDGGVRVRMPAEWAADWAASERVGFEAAQDAGDGATLSILVEKDFQCLHREDEGRDPDAFAHPEADPDASFRIRKA